MKNISGRNILITGAAGFLGTHLIDALLKNDFHITALDIVAPQNEQSGVTWLQKDLIKDDLTEIFEDIDVVFHLVGKYLAGNNEYILNDLNTINVQTTSKIAQYASLSNIKRVIYISSIAACEESNERVITEDSGHPVSSYGLSKLKGEETLIANLSRDVQYMIFRPVAFFGEGHLGSIYDLTRIIKRKKFVMIGNGGNYVNFLYVKDLVQSLLEIGLSEDIFNEKIIVSDEPLELKKLVDVICDELGTRKHSFSIPKKIAIAIGFSFDILAKTFGITLPLSLNRVNAMTRDKWYSNAKMRRYLPVYNYGVVTGLKRSIAWYKENDLL